MSTTVYTYNDRLVGVGNDQILGTSQGGGASYTAGDYISIDNDEISVTGIYAGNGTLSIVQNVTGAPLEITYPTDVAPDAVFYQINSVTGYAYAPSTSHTVINYYYGETPADFNSSDDFIRFTIDDNLSNVSYINFYYAQTESSMGGPNLSQTAIAGDSTGVIQSGTYKLKAQYNQAEYGGGGGYGKYLQIMFGWKYYAADAAQALQWTQEALSKITFFGVTRPDPSLGVTVNLDRYYLGNTNTITNTYGYPEAAVYTDSISKKQTIYLPNSMPSNWSANGNIVQAFEYGSNLNSPSNSNYSTKQYRAYKYTSSPRRYQFAYCTDWDDANKLMTFVAYDNSGNAIEKWTLDYTTYRSNVWTTTPISSSGSSYTAGQYISIDNNDVIAVTGLAPVSGSDGIAVDNNVVSLDTPVEIVAGENITISVTGASAIFSAQTVGVTEAQVYDATVTAVQAATGAIPTFTEGNCIDITSNAISWETTAGITDIISVTALPANPVATVIYLIPET